MNNFSFSNLSETSFTNDAPLYLKPYDIYKVTLNKIEKTTIKGKNDIVYNIVAIEFQGCENKGVFNANLFVPTKDEDFERRNNSTSGAQYPSAFEQFQYTLMQMVQVINPTGAQKIIANSDKIKTIDQFIDLVVKALTNKTDVEVYLKLVGRKGANGVYYAALPNACVLGRDATPQTKPSALNFISSDESKLQFSNYEMTEMNKYKTAKPTNMEEVEKNNPDEATGDIDINDLDV